MRRLPALAVIAAMTLTAAPAAAYTDHTCPPQSVPEDGFTDVPDSNTHEFSVDCLVGWGLANGVSEGQFAPGKPVTRGQMASFLDLLLKMAGYTDAHTSDHFDDDSGSPHETAINRMYAYGVVSGVGPRRFEPSAPVTRAQMATFLVQLYEWNGPRPQDRIESGPERFRDDDRSIHEDNINLAAAYEFVSGNGDDYYPDRHVTRAQMGTFMMNITDRLFRRDGALSPPSWWRPAE